MNPNRVKVYNAIKNYRNENGYGPTLRDITTDTGLCKSTVINHIIFLVAGGYVTKQKRVPRSLQLTEKKLPK